MTTTTETIHLWELAGHGKAPFRLVGMISLPSPTIAEQNPMGYQNAMIEVSQRSRALGINCGSCDVCGTGITNNFVIESADHKRFVCGCDCVQKSGDAGVVHSVEHAKKLEAKARRDSKRAAERAAEWERTRPEREARQAEWERLERERIEREAAIAESNKWLLDVLRSVPTSGGGFIDSMIGELQRKHISDLSGRCVDILASIYAKHHGRAGSKAYKAAEAEFYRIIEG